MIDYPLTDFKSLIYFIIIYTSFLFILSRIIKVNNWDNKISFLLFFWHTIISLVASTLEFNAILISDSYSPFEYKPKIFEPIKLLKPGNTFIFEFVNLLRLLDFSYLVISAFFQCLGAITLIIFYNCINKCVVSKNYYLKYSIIFFFMIPSFSYWSSFFSKDTLTFFSISLFVFYIAYNNKRSLFFCLFLLMIVRPHLIVFIAVYLLANYVIKKIQSNNSWIYKVFIIFLIYILSTLLINLVLLLSNLENNIGLNVNIFLILDKIWDMILISQNSYKDTNYAINEMNPFLRFLKYILGPIVPKKIISLEIIWIIENLFLTFVIILSSIELKKKKITKNFSKKISLLFISIFFLFFLSATANNYGISMRQKWPYISLLIFSICYLNIRLKNFFLIARKTKTKNI
jgi:hypothetical protein